MPLFFKVETGSKITPGGAANIEGHSQVYYVDRESCARILNEHFRSETGQVPAEKLGLATGYEYLYGMNVDEGKTMGGVLGDAEGAASAPEMGAGASQPAA